jgi:hypothetical protein
MKTLSGLILLITAQSAISQQWHWIRDDRVVNSTGVYLRDNSTQFNMLDWNDDGLPDFILNEIGGMSYYEQIAGETFFWAFRNLNLPMIGNVKPLYDSGLGLPKNFRFVDWDKDDDFDLAADSSRFWWNTSSNDSPIWQSDSLLLGNIPFGSDFSFADYDADGDWDAVADPLYEDGPDLYLNQGTDMMPVWSRLDSLLIISRTTSQPAPLGEIVSFVDLNGDTLLDLAAVNPAGTSDALLDLRAFLNRGTRFEPIWKNQTDPIGQWTSYFGIFTPSYDFVDFNRDALIDVVQSDWNGRVGLHLNRGTSDAPAFGNEFDELFGNRIFAGRRVRPYFFDADQDVQPDLLITDNSHATFLNTYYEEGAIRMYENRNGFFDPQFDMTRNVPRPFQVYFYRNNFTFSFADDDHDGDTDYLLSYHVVGDGNVYRWSDIVYFENRGNDAAADWRQSSSRYSFFLTPDSNYFDPQLTDIDHDGDFDLFLQVNRSYCFYERLNTPEETWQKNDSWLSGLEGVEHNSAAFADLTADGLLDLIFGETDGTLQLYKNIGSANMPAWQLVTDAFSGIDVDSLAVPAFADLDGDSKLDLVIGNADGRLFYFRNETIVAVEQNPEEMPRQFTLHQNYPNPFNPETTIEYDLPQAGRVRFTIYNLLGQRVRTLVNGWQPAGPHHVSWDGTGESGVKSVSGVYAYELRISETILRKKMVLLH